MALGYRFLDPLTFDHSHVLKFCIIVNVVGHPLRPVGVGHGGDDAVSVEPGEQISVGVEIAAGAEDLLQAGGGEIDEGAQQIVCTAVAIGDEGEAQRLGGRQLGGDLRPVGQRGVVEDDEAGDVDLFLYKKLATDT
ncbi:hypothetical protein N7530_010664 [Penicillium desertorum]|uniref:Uncharacterized protein n=1 Tax=Penicillium desertorum TaxID=1303715 RepID=A0A9X0BHV1_9EURO|nr:hypothetical protein N7530_010664 [Penicillium desertorum]